MSDTPSFTEQVIANQLPDGYWLEAFPFTTDDGPPHLIGYGLGTSDAASKIKLYWNPNNRNANTSGDSQSGAWSSTEIQSLDFPVALTYADLTGDGSNDVIICDRYGPTMDNLWDAETDDGGRVQWLRNPGYDAIANASDPSVVHWEAKHIGNSTGMHRLKAGHFTTTDRIQIMAIPIISKSSDLTSPAPVIIYTPIYDDSTKSQGPSDWKEDIVQFDQGAQFRLIHEIKVVPSEEDGGLDQAIVAGREGITLFWYDSNDGWKHNIIGTGLAQTTGNPYWGTGSVDIGRVGDDPVGYIATVEAFHGDTVSVYVKKKTDPKGRASLKTSSLWTRFVITTFAPLNENHTGTLHHVVCGDFQKTGTDSFVIACMGDPIGDQDNIGMYTFIPQNLYTGDFDRYHISTESAGRIALADFRGVGSLDIGSIIYYVPGYLTPPGDRSIRILYPTPAYESTTIGMFEVSRLVNEVFVRVPRPTVANVSCGMGMPMIEVAGKRLWICVLPPNTSIKFQCQDGIKVIFGQVTMTTQDGKTVTRGIAPAAKTVSSTMVLSQDGTITAGKAGAVFVRLEYLANTSQGPYNTMSDVSSTIKNVFPATMPPDVQALLFPFIKVQDLPWASSGLWDGFEFYNMTGFHVFYNDDAMDKVAHIQLWTLGIGETARFHNHTDKSFCEIHMCINNGGGEGGMRYFSDSYTDPIDTKKELTKQYVEDNSTLIVVPSMAEHGPLWKVQSGTDATPQLRPNDTVDYPWHAWLSSHFGDYTLPIDPPLTADTQKYDVWMAFEFPSTAFQGPLTEN